MSERQLSDTELRDLFNRADLAGRTAAAFTVPVPMLVGHPSTPFGDDVDLSQPHEVVPGGLCGFSWVRLLPGTSRAARFAKKHLGARAAYNGGTTIWCPLPTQSVMLKEAWATAYAKVLRDAGIRAYDESRLD